MVFIVVYTTHNVYLGVHTLAGVAQDIDNDGNETVSLGHHDILRQASVSFHLHNFNVTTSGFVRTVFVT